jgi:hypothetical protein
MLFSGIFCLLANNSVNTNGDWLISELLQMVMPDILLMRPRRPLPELVKRPNQNR